MGQEADVDGDIFQQDLKTTALVTRMPHGGPGGKGVFPPFSLKCKAIGTKYLEQGTTGTAEL